MYKLIERFDAGVPATTFSEFKFNTLVIKLAAGETPVVVYGQSDPARDGQDEGSFAIGD